MSMLWNASESSLEVSNPKGLSMLRSEPVLCASEPNQGERGGYREGDRNWR